jgi:glycosyltransferase involved in cell wall biosynthesis
MPTILVNLLQSTGTKGGIEIYAKELYRQPALALSEFTFIAVASRELAKTDTSWFPGEVIDSGISGENRISWAWGELTAVNAHAKRLGADLIHGPAMFGPLRSRVPVVISVHDVLYFSHPELMQSPLLTEPVKIMERLAARTAAHVITISEYSRRGIEKYLKVPAERISVIPLAGRNARPNSNAKRARSSSPLFLAMGQRSPYKNFETIVKAWALIPEADRPQLVITGSHGDDPLVPLVHALQLDKWVSLKSWVSVDELAELFRNATAIIDSTLATGFSMPTLEAMTIGVPVLLANTEVFREVGGDAAEYFTAGDPASLATQVAAIQHDEKLLQRMSERGFTRSEPYSWTRVADETLGVFRAVIRK